MKAKLTVMVDKSTLARRARRDHAESLERAHEAAAYDKWFRSQVQAALGDPRPSIPHEEVAARWAKQRVRIRRRGKAISRR